MPASPHLLVTIDLPRIRRNAADIASATGVAVLAVIKADAYGLGAQRVAQALADTVDGFCVFSLVEAISAQLWMRTRKPAVALGHDTDASADDYLAHHVRPAVWTIGRATSLRAARPVLSVDTGMQRFACPAADVDAVLAAGGCDEAFTHATCIEHVQLLLERVGGRGLRLHASGSSLLHEPSARLDAVRPGIALYRGAARVTTRLVDARKSNGPVGYTRFTAKYHGVIRGGYFNGLRPGPCLINGRASRIVEVGMQSAYVLAGPDDSVGDEVVLLGDSLTEASVAGAWARGEHEVLTTLCGAGRRVYVE